MNESSLEILSGIGDLRSTQTRFIWTIKNFDNIILTCKKISSNGFTTMTDGKETQWVLHLFLKDDSEEKDDIGIYIECVNRTKILATVEFYILDVNDKVASNYTLAKEKFRPGDLWGTPMFMDKNDLINREKELYSKHNSLRIVCVIITNESIRIEEEKEELRRKDWQRLKEFSKFVDLWQNKEFSDVIISVQGEEIPAHRNILASGSVVFKAMFVHEMLESQSNRVVVEDVDAETMHYILEFIYTGTIKDVDKDLCCKKYLKLLVAAEKYCLESLKIRCEERLAERLTVENVFECLSQAELNNAFFLKQECAEFVITNAEKIVETPLFEAFVESEPKISCEVFRALVAKRKKLE